MCKKCAQPKGSRRKRHISVSDADILTEQTVIKKEKYTESS